MDSAVVAGYIAARVGNVTHEERVRLQKMLYYADGWAMAWTGRRLLDDDFEAWREGPVIRRVQHGAISRVSSLPKREQSIVDAVLEHYAAVGAVALSDATHVEVPWMEARGDLPPEAASSNVISTRAMRRFFVEQAVSGADVPRRPRDTVEDADAAVVARVGERARARWKEALDELADR